MPKATPRGLGWSPRTRVAAGLGLGVVLALALLLLRSTPLAQGLELRLIDLRTRHYAGSRPLDPRIVMVQVADADVAWVQENFAVGWPWDLGINALVFRTMREAGAKAALVDVLHLDRGAGLDDVAGAESLPPHERQRLEGEAAGAEDYGGALQEWGRVALAYELASSPEPEIPARVAAARPRLAPAGLSRSPGAPAYAGARLPVSRIAKGAAFLGFTNVLPDIDGVVRRVPVLARWGTSTAISFAAAGAQLATGQDLKAQDDGVLVGGELRRLEPDSSFLMDFRSLSFQPYPQLTVRQILAWAREKEGTGTMPGAARAALEGKIVVWGVNLAGHKDIVATPIGNAYDGPVLQATALDNLLQGGGRVRAGALANAVLLFAACTLVGALGFALKRKGPHLAAVGVFVAVVAAGFLVFARGVSLDMFTPLLGVLLTWGSATAARLLTEGRYNRWLESAFSRYLAPSVIESLKADPALLELGGHRRELTILFSDVAGFTNHSRKLKPEQLVELLNTYLTPHSDAVFRNGGVVDKFIGDAVMAFFGDPIPLTDHAERACRTALQVIEGLPAVEPMWRKLGLTEFHVRVGLNSGDAVVGNMGSAQRLDYTCMGDTVNLASRLEGANKAFHTTILIGPKTYEQAKHAIVAKPIARVVVVGWDQPVPVYELLAMATGASAALVEHAEIFTKAQEAARAGDLDAASRWLEQAERLRPGDGPVSWFADVIAAMRAGREPSPWTGVVTLAGK